MDKIAMAAGLLVAWTVLIWWFFFGPRRAAAARLGAAGAQELDVVVQGGYSPAHIEVRRGVPVRLRFRRLESSSCSERVLFPDFNISKRLPENEVTVVEFSPDKDGTFTFSCGMGMYQGTLVVKGGEGA